MRSRLETTVPLQHQVRFLRSALASMRDTGAVLPSGRPLAYELARFLRGRATGRPVRVLEVGAGNGAVTRVLFAHLRPGDHLDAVEVNKEYVEDLTETLAEAADGSPGTGYTIHTADVRDLAPETDYDLIVSGLPFANFTHEETRDILDFYMEHIAPRGHMSLYGYLFTRELKAVTASRASYTRQRLSQRLVDRFVRDHLVVSKRVWRNVPPAWVHHLRREVD